MSRVVVGPLSRVEGDLEVALELEDGAVREAFVCAPLYRGFEQLLLGKAPLDALVLVPRVCGICSVAQSAAAAGALAAAMGLAPTPNGQVATNLVLACENVADHLSHFYLFFMPDLARPAYAARPWFAALEPRFRATTGTAAAELLQARARFLEVVALLAGKWPHSLALQPGGTTRPVQPHEKLRLAVVLRELRAFVERTLLDDALERFAALGSREALRAWAARGGGDLRAFLRAAEDLGLERLGRAGDAFLSYGAYPGGGDAGPLLARGVWDGAARALDVAAIREDARFAWLAADGGPRHPRAGLTEPLPDKPGAYTWCKAPRLAGRVVEVGALARQVVDGHPLARDLLAAAGGNVLARVVARLLEVARLVPAMERWARALAPGEPWCRDGAVPAEAEGAGLVEAARGSLGHWLAIRGGRIAAYQIVAPTTWNFSPRDAAGTPGALEQALRGVPAGGAAGTRLVEHVIRSFDPCLACTVH